MVDSTPRFGGSEFDKYMDEKVSDEEDVGYQSLGRNIKVMVVSKTFVYIIITFCTILRAFLSFTCSILF